MKWREVALTAGIGASGPFRTRTTLAQESAACAALVAVCEEASRLKGRRFLRDVALVFAGAGAGVCPRVKTGQIKRRSRPQGEEERVVDVHEDTMTER